MSNFTRHFLCAIPCQNKKIHIFERKEIVEWLDINSVNPMDQTNLTLEDLEYDQECADVIIKALVAEGNKLVNRERKEEVLWVARVRQAIKLLHASLPEGAGAGARSLQCFSRYSID